MAKLFSVPRRLDACHAIRAVAIDIFKCSIPAPTRVTNTYTETKTIIINTPIGDCEWNVSCSESLLHVYCQYVGDMTPERRAFSSLVGGNPVSGKLNLWFAPEQKISDEAEWIAYKLRICGLYRKFATRIAQGS